MGTFGRNHTCDSVQAPYILSYTTASTAGILALVTVPGNVFICIAMAKDPHRELKTSFNYLVLNLAVADLIAGLVTEPVFVVYHFLEANRQSIAQYIWIVHVSYFITCLASLQSIAALSMERYFSVTSTQRRRLPPKRAVQVSVVIWVISLSVSQVYFALEFYRFVFIFANVAILTTLGIIIFAYIRIYQSLHERVGNEQEGGTNEEKRKMRRSQAYEKKATRAFIFILIVFISCNISSCIATYALTFCTICNCNVIHWLRDFQFLFALINCSANQFLYALRMPTFKRALRSIVGIPRVGHMGEVTGDESGSCSQSNTRNIKDEQENGRLSI